MAKFTDIMLLQQPQQHALVIERQGDMATFGKLIADGFAEISAYLKEEGELPSDIPCVEYPAFNEMTENNIRMVISCYTSKPFAGKGDIQSIIIPERKVVACLYKGSYEEQAKLYNEMMEWIKENGFEGTGSSIEHYYTAPEVPQEEQITRIIMPLC
ncbi:effector-binding domain-containing protein [Dysgonomonadaceae bacterium PH5-43]|nr:effector-binding domain-containing protein [Dysgonomonadaceae bacterium PH5-43]